MRIVLFLPGAQWSVRISCLKFPIWFISVKWFFYMCLSGLVKQAGLFTRNSFHVMKGNPWDAPIKHALSCWSMDFYLATSIIEQIHRTCVQSVCIHTLIFTHVPHTLHILTHSNTRVDLRPSPKWHMVNQGYLSVHWPFGSDALLLSVPTSACVMNKAMLPTRPYYGHVQTCNTNVTSCTPRVTWPYLNNLT